MIAAFLTGEIDVALDLQSRPTTTRSRASIRSSARRILEPAWLYEHFDMNQAGLGQGKGHPALKDIVVRQAIEQAIDKKAMWDDRLPGLAVPGQQPLHQRHPDELLAAPGRQVPAVRRRRGQHGARRRRLHEGRRRDPGRSQVEASARVRALHVDGRLPPARRRLLREVAADAIGIKLNLNFVDSTTILFANWPDVKADTKCNLSHGNYDTSEFAYVLAFDLYGDYYYAITREQIPTDANKGNGYNYLRSDQLGHGRGDRRSEEGDQAGRPGPGGLQDPGGLPRPDPRGRPLLPQRSAWCRASSSRTSSRTRPRPPICGISKTGGSAVASG